MKKIMVISTALLFTMAIELSAEPRQGISLSFFYSSLRPYGEWIQIEPDLIVWRPARVHRSWKPYLLGRWSWTSQGWYWDSYEPFGWVTYHYGRWYYDDYYGWIWVPDYDWAPAWVEWRYDDYYIGWAPLPPYASFHIDLGIHFSIGWRSSYNYWNFVTYNRFCDPRINDYIIDSRKTARIFERTKYRTNYYSDRGLLINGGIDKSFVERRAGYRIAEREISSVDNYRDFERTRNLRSDRIVVYRPSDRDIMSERSDNNFEIKRGERNSTLERDKIRTPLSRDDGRNVIIDRTAERKRDVNVNRDDLNKDDKRIREQIKRGRIIDRPPSEKEIERSRPERAPNKRIEIRNEERTYRDMQRESTPSFERQNRNERSQEPEQRVEPRRELSTERPAQRVENRDRGDERNPSRERGKSAERKR